jgi:hypothetical protein
VAVFVLVACIEQGRGPALLPDSPGQQVKQTLEDLWRDLEPHPIGSEAHDILQERLVDTLEARGLSPTLQQAIQCTSANRCAELTNIIVHIPGEQEDALLLSAHYDSVPASPGAGDDGAGVATLVEAATEWGKRPAKNSLILLLNDGEELGLLGASAFMTEHPLASQVKAVINLEARGSSGPAWMFEMGPSSQHLLEAFAANTSTAYTSSIAATVYGWLSNATDVDVYAAHDLPALNFAFLAGGAHYHTAHDSIANLADRSIQSHTNNVWSLITALRDAPLEPSPRPPVVFFDVLGWLIILPVSWMWGLGLGLTSASALLIHRLRPQNWAWALMSWSGYLASTALTGLVTIELLNFSSQNLRGWTSAPRTSAFALFVALLAWSMEWAGRNRHYSRRAVLLAITTTTSCLTLLSLLTLPVASYLFAFPALAAILAIGIHSYRPDWYPQALLIIHLTALLLWAPVASGLHAALELDVAPLLALIFAISFGPMMLLLPAPSKHSRSLALLPIAIAMAFILVSVPSIHNTPRAANLVFTSQTGIGEGRIHLVTSPEPLPPEAKALRALREQRRLTPWIGSKTPSAPLSAPLQPTLAANLAIQTEPSSGVSTITGTISPRADAAVMGLALHQRAGVERLTLNGQTMPLRYRGNWAVVHLHGFQASPHLSFAASLELGTAYIFDIRYGLPEAALEEQIERDRYGVPFSQGDRSIAFEPLIPAQEQPTTQEP